ncbi:MAG: hypothetical protein KDI37_06070, partial [Xanthomonadales bacterium]|nr:hypothetical protein [Xanthomonadales bacterium]
PHERIDGAKSFGEFGMDAGPLVYGSRLENTDASRGAPDARAVAVATLIAPSHSSKIDCHDPEGLMKQQRDA